MAYDQLVLVILDGWGVGPAWGGNAITQARTPFVNMLWGEPYSILAASGQAVGLPGHERGNSEVGHLNLGSGRVIQEDVTRIAAAIEDGTFATNPVLLQAFEKAKNNGNRVHLMGIVTKTAIHGLTNHALALLDIAKTVGVPDVRLHCFTDGRDSAPRDGLGEILDLDEYCRKLGFARIQTVGGRYYAMDRDSHWDRIEQAYNAIALGKGKIATGAKSAVAQAYASGTTDEFIEPTVIQTPDAVAYAGIEPGDVVIFWNFRADRARELTEAMTNPSFLKFKRSPLGIGKFITMVPYTTEYAAFGVQSAFLPPSVPNVLAEAIAKSGASQFHIAETEKYAHVTYFFNGGREQAFAGEERLLIPSPKVPTFDLKPEMSAAGITHELLRAITSKKYRLCVANYANADMVGHTGNFRAAVEAVEVIDAQLLEIARVCQKEKIPLLITADHGNVEQMVNPITGEPSTDHTTNPVPCHFVLPNEAQIGRSDGRLADVAPTVLNLLGIPTPVEMSGSNLLRINGF